MKENRGRPTENVVKKMKYVLEFKDSRWHYDLNKFPRGPYLVEQLDTTYEEDIELILEEANAFGLRWEVDSSAKQIIDENPMLPKLEAYVMAYNEWIK